MFGVISSGGSPTYALVEINFNNIAQQHTVQLMRGASSTIFAGGTVSCP